MQPWFFHFFTVDEEALKKSCDDYAIWGFRNLAPSELVAVMTIMVVNCSAVGVSFVAPVRQDVPLFFVGLLIFFLTFFYLCFVLTELPFCPLNLTVFKIKKSVQKMKISLSLIHI